jgi:uncharacterized delta-60 repeat protein
VLASFVIGIPQVSGRLRSRSPGWLSVAATLAVAIADLLGAGSAQARLAQLDPSFGHGGIVTTAFVGYPADVIVLPDRSLLVLMSPADVAHDEIALARYLPNGSLDKSFGTRGFVTTQFGDGISPSAMTLGPGGKILVVGTGFIGPENHTTDVVTLVRYDSNGSLDRTFGSDGIVAQSSPSIGREGTSVLVEPHGSILVGGWNQGFMVARYTANGKSLDPTFDGDGVAGVPSDIDGCGSSSPDGTHSLTLAGGGSIIADGDCRVSGSTGAAVLDFDGGSSPLSGHLDASFGVGGSVVSPFSVPSFASGLIRRPDGSLVQLVQIGYSDEGAQIGLAAYTATGAFDRFGPNGSVTFGLGTHNSDPVGIALAPTGKILVAANDATDDGTFALARREANGSVDTSFTPSGVFIVHVGKAGPTSPFDQSGAGTIALQPDGRVIEAGVVMKNNEYHVVLVRFGRPPELSGLEASGRRLAYSDTQAAVTTLRVIAVNNHGRSTLGSVTHHDHRGRNQLELPAHLNGLELGKGRYLVKATPVADGLTGATASVRFTLGG